MGGDLAHFHGAAPDNWVHYPPEPAYEPGELPFLLYDFAVPATTMEELLAYGAPSEYRPEFHEPPLPPPLADLLPVEFFEVAVPVPTGRIGPVVFELAVPSVACLALAGSVTFERADGVTVVVEIPEELPI